MVPWEFPHPQKPGVKWGGNADTWPKVKNGLAWDEQNST